MLNYIGPVITELTATYTPKEVAKTIGVTQAMISTWKQKDNDFCPRIGVASKIYANYNIVVYPYSEEALESYDT